MYIDLAGSNYLGLALRAKVEDSWIQWVDHVTSAPWLRNWRHSPLFGCEGDTPAGRSVDMQMILNYPKSDKLKSEPYQIIRCGSIAAAIFSSAVWGFGLAGWQTPVEAGSMEGKDSRGTKVRLKVAMDTILKLQGCTAPNNLRTYFWHGALPCEYYDLDEWLKGLSAEIFF